MAMLNRTIDRRPVSRTAWTVVLACLLLATLSVAAIAAARQFASVAGTVVDPTNGLLPGVTLTLTNTDTSAKYEITSDRQGRYEFVALPPGTYQLETKLPGFAVFRSSLTVAGQPVRQDLMLSLGSIEETIRIVGSAAPESLTPEEQQARDARRARDRERIAAARQAQMARCAKGGAPNSIGGNIRVPVKLRDVRPGYPATLQGEDGQVVLAAVIGTDGHVHHVQVVSATHQEFAEAASDAVRQWEFDATVLNCERVETAMTVTATFSWQ
jgi:TonB family protein